MKSNEKDACNSECIRVSSSSASGCKNVYMLIVFALVSSLLAAALAVVSLTRKDSQVLQSFMQDPAFTAEVEKIVKQYISINYAEEFTRSRR